MIPHPTIGRNVHYVIREGMKPADRFAAIVTRPGDGHGLRVDLIVFRHDGIGFEFGVFHRENSGELEGYWEWPPGTREADQA